MQQICTSSIGKSTPHLYPESMLLLSIHLNMTDTSGSICGAIPSPIFMESVENFDFDSIQNNICSRLASS